MIKGVHVLLHSRDAEADRAFLRDQLGFPHVDAGDGWLIFKLPPAEAGVHPTEGRPSHEMSLICDDVDATIAEFAAKGVEIVKPVVDVGFGWEASIRLPSGAELAIYQPAHRTAYNI